MLAMSSWSSSFKSTCIISVVPGNTGISTITLGMNCFASAIRSNVCRRAILGIGHPDAKTNFIQTRFAQGLQDRLHRCGRRKCRGVCTPSEISGRHSERIRWFPV